MFIICSNCHSISSFSFFDHVYPLLIVVHVTLPDQTERKIGGLRPPSPPLLFHKAQLRKRLSSCSSACFSTSFTKYIYSSCFVICPFFIFTIFTIVIEIHHSHLVVHLHRLITHHIFASSDVYQALPAVILESRFAQASVIILRPMIFQ